MPLPAWAQRAIDHPEMHTKLNQSVYTASGEYNGKEILFPTVRARGAGLETLTFDAAKREAIQRGDFLEFDNPEEATAWGKAFSEQLGRLGSREGLQRAKEPPPMSDYYTMRLDPDTYQPVESGGRFYNMPGLDPVSGKPMKPERALDYALRRGYLGRGFNTENEAAFEADARTEKELWRPRSTIAGLVRALIPGERDEDLWRHMPFNPGGRAIDGFQYPGWDEEYERNNLAPLDRRRPKDLEEQVEFDHAIANRFGVELPEGRPRGFDSDAEREASIQDSKDLIFGE
jgi:hypothetical protein